jgi:hypothetical protein
VSDILCGCSQCRAEGKCCDQDHWGPKEDTWRGDNVECLGCPAGLKEPYQLPIEIAYDECCGMGCCEGADVDEDYVAPKSDYSLDVGVLTLPIERVILEYLECTEPLTREIIGVALDDIKTFDRKQHDYGSGNIAKFGERGVLVRASDKLERLINLANRPDVATNESIEDSWRDLTVYGMIARLCRAGKWPKKEEVWT